MVKKREIPPGVIIPMPVVLVGAEVDGRANFMTVAWCSQANANPPMILCAISASHYTTKGILETETFSVNLPSSALIEKTDYCGIVSGEAVDKSDLFTLFYGTLQTAPMIQECPVSLECRLVQSLPLAAGTQIVIGEVVGTYVDEDVIMDEQPDIAAIDPLLLTMPDGHYRALGDPVGEAWRVGKTLVGRSGKP